MCYRILFKCATEYCLNVLQNTVVAVNVSTGSSNSSSSCSSSSSSSSSSKLKYKYRFIQLPCFYMEEK
jgi:hypothetical protein